MEQEWSKQVADLLRKVIHERNARPSETINKQTWLDELVELLKVNLTHLKDNFEKL